MTVATGTKPHPIFLAGRWVDSPDVLEVSNPADPDNPAGSTFHATSAQYEEAVDRRRRGLRGDAAAAGLRAGQDPARDLGRDQGAPGGDRAGCSPLEAGKPIRDALVEVDRAVADVPARGRGGGADHRRDRSRST